MRSVIGSELAFLDTRRLSAVPFGGIVLTSGS
jgi:hypothetical protein